MRRVGAPVEDLGKLHVENQTGLEAARALSFVRDHYIGTAQKRLKREVFEAIDQGTLDPQFAVQCWLRMHAMDRLEQDLDRLATRGVAAGERLSEAQEKT